MRGQNLLKVTFMEEKRTLELFQIQKNGLIESFQTSFKSFDGWKLENLSLLTKDCVPLFKFRKHCCFGNVDHLLGPTTKQGQLEPWCCQTLASLGGVTTARQSNCGGKPLMALLQNRVQADSKLGTELACKKLLSFKELITLTKCKVCCQINSF